MEVSPALAIERVIDLALREVPGIQPGILYVERQFGVLEIHSADLDEVRRAGEAILAGTGNTASDQLRPRVLYHDIITDITDQHAVILNRNRQASMILPGQSLLVYEMTPGPVRRGRGERGRTGGARAYRGGCADDRRGRAALHRRQHRRRDSGPRSDHLGTRPDRGTGPLVIADDRAVAEQARAHYDISPPGASLRLLNLSENATYLVTDGDSRSILRVHRQDYHRPHEIESELDWLAALKAEGDVTVPTVLPARDGRRVVTVDGPPIPADHPSCRAFRDGQRSRAGRERADA